jgi:hypothetical protein
MRKANVTVSNRLLETRLTEAHMNEHDRLRALNALRDADAIADAILWAKEKIASIGTVFLRPGFRN